jgi:hypothetical protein
MFDYPSAEDFDAPFPSFLENLTDDKAIFAAFDKIDVLAYTPLAVTHYFVHYDITCIFTSLE